MDGREVKMKKRNCDKGKSVSCVRRKEMESEM